MDVSRNILFPLSPARRTDEVWMGLADAALKFPFFSDAFSKKKQLLVASAGIHEKTNESYSGKKEFLMRSRFHEIK